MLAPEATSFVNQIDWPLVDVEILGQICSQTSGWRRTTDGLQTEIVRTGLVHAQVLEVEVARSTSNASAKGGIWCWAVNSEAPMPEWK